MTTMATPWTSPEIGRMSILMAAHSMKNRATTVPWTKNLIIWRIAMRHFALPSPASSSAVSSARARAAKITIGTSPTEKKLAMKKKNSLSCFSKYSEKRE